MARPKRQRDTSDVNGFATVRDACQFLRVSKPTLYVLINRGDLKSFKHGARRKFHWTVLREYADAFLE